MKKLVLLAVVFGCVCGGIGQVSHAATMVVAVGGGAEYTDIQTAIDAAADGDTVSVQVGEYVIGETITFGGKAITVVAEGGSDATMLRGAEETGTVVRFDGAETENAVLEGFTVTSVDGNGVECGEGCSPTLRNCVITGSAGSGVYCDSGSTPTLVGCTMTGNTGSLGGGLYCGPGSSPTLTDCTISRNFAFQGGGVYCAEGSSPTLTGCVVSNNCCLPLGGGGGLFLEGSVAVLENCTIVGNLSTQRGGGLFCLGSSPTLKGCTIAGNLAFAGSGMYVEDSSSATLSSSIVWGNAGTSLSVESDSSIDVTYSLIEGDELPGGVGNLSADPQFCGWETPEVAVTDQQSLEDALNFRYSLSSQSPCVGTGEGGTNMGADAGLCDATGTPERLVRLAAGTYSVTPINLWQHVSLEGASQEDTVLEGAVRGLRTDASLSSLTVSGALEIESGEAPEITDSTITGSGVRCRQDSAPTLRDCTITGSGWSGVSCDMGSSPTLIHCTITGNQGPGISGYEAEPVIESSIVWDNLYGSFDLNYSPTVTYSCVEGGDVHAGAGNINADPLFCGWESDEVSVADEAGLEDATDPSSFRLSLAASSPCLGSAEDGTDMGAGTGTCDGPAFAGRLVRLAAGTYTGYTLLAHRLSLEGAGREDTTLQGSVLGLRTGASLSSLTVERGVRIGRGQAPEIRDCTILSGGVQCEESSSPTLTDCVITGSSWVGVSCDMGSSPTLIHCTITGNQGPGISGYEAEPVIESSIVWDNGGGSFELGPEREVNDPLFRPGGGATVRYSCVESPAPAGAGNINADPLFCGWESDEVSVADEAGLEDATDPSSFRLSLAASSPCLGSAEDGTDMGAGTGTCDGPAFAGRLVRLAAGTYTGYTPLAHRLSLEGAGREDTTLQGSVLGLRTGASLSSLTVEGGVWIGRGQAPEIRDCTILSGGVQCEESSSPTLTDCIITGSSWVGVSCDMGSSPTLIHCTITGNLGSGISGYEAEPVIESSIVWDNGGGSIESGDGLSLAITSSCVEGAEVHAGEGNINADPLFCGWESSEVSVEDDVGLRDALDPAAFDLSLAPGSPCAGSAADGTNMGADTGTCDSPGSSGRLVRLAPGVYSPYLHHFVHGVSIEGTGQDDTLLRGTVVGLTTGSALVNLTVAEGGIRVGRGQAPEIRDCLITSGYQGVYCEEDSSPTLSGCTITGVMSDGVHCREGASPQLIHCTITGNQGAGIGGYDAQPRIENSIVWNNGQDSLQFVSGVSPTTRYSCVEGEEVPPGEGNINVDPRFCGWESDEVTIESGADLGDALGLPAFRLALAEDSPCAGTAEGGANMGAEAGVCLSDEVVVTRRIRLPAGSYNLGGTAPPPYPFTLEGAGEDATTVQGLSSLVTGTEVSDLTILGGITFDGQSPVLRRVTIAGGSGVSCLSGASPLLEDCTLSGNTAERGGALRCEDGASPVLRRCMLTGNSAAAGGGAVYVSGTATVALIDCTLSGNVTTGNSDGGAVFVDRAFAALEGCVLSANAAGGDGGAVDCKQGTLALTNCLITGNLAMGRAGGVITRRYSTVSLMSCTIAGNVSQDTGGGLYVSFRATPVITNSIVWDNTPPSIDMGADAAPEVSYTLTEGALLWPGAGNIAVDPRFERSGVFDVSRFQEGSDVRPDFIVEAGDYRLQSGSPAIDAGTPENAPATDIEGGERLCGASVDLGAFENCSDVPVALLRGDCNGDGVVGGTVDDAILLLDFNFLGKSAPPCLAACDANGNGVVLGTVEDAIYVLNFSFVGGPAPAAPFPECGPATESDEVLGCATPPTCE